MNAPLDPTKILARIADPDADAVDCAVDLAAELLQRAMQLQTPHERKQQMEFDRMMRTPHDKTILTQITDQAFRSQRSPRAADQLVHILDVQGIPRFFGPLDRTLLRGFQTFGSHLPGVAVPLVKEKMRDETANVILPAEPELLGRHLRERGRAGLRMNVNFLGEELLGETEAQERLAKYLAALQHPDIEVMSVKISTIYSQISALGWTHSLAVLCERLEHLYRTAHHMVYRDHDGKEHPKFVYLDMEAYRDLQITAEAFMRTLERPGLEQIEAGIALQGYIPDSFAVQKRLSEWARQRVAAGGAPITIRIVKGANLEMERVEASIEGWAQAPYTDKLDVDANYKRMLQWGLQPENIAAVRLGIASHNLFDVAYALVCGVRNDCIPQMQFEMLEGMANHQRRALCELVDDMLLYAPATPRDGFLNAIGYLVRRLDENTGPENFLCHSFKLTVGSPDWHQLEAGFRASFDRIESLSEAPRRRQNRQHPPPPSPGLDSPFVNEPNTDFSLPANLSWAEQISSAPQTVPLVLAGQVILDRELRDSYDPSRPGVVVANSAQATRADAESAIQCACDDPDGWRDRPVRERCELLVAAAQIVRERRAELMGAARAEGGKTLAESDPELSEAVDFLEYYARSAMRQETMEHVACKPLGVVTVITPWNFPIAIPCGGVAAALAAGNTVILKPAPETPLTAWLMCQCLWDAGIPRSALQFLPGDGPTVGATLASDPRVGAVVFTGGTATALAIKAARPSVNLLAETGGKNATIVTAMADREQAIRHVLHSAFGHAGQKCSATSLLVLEEEVYQDKQFERALVDAARSLHVGSAWELHNRVGPLIREPQPPLRNALKELELGERWALMPQSLEDNPQLYSPGIKWGVRPGGFTHMTEFFGPLLAVIRARDLAEAVDIVNATGYGLTSGLESLDDREHDYWRANIQAGNLYINRPTTGAIVQRQPFGGFGKSAFGSGIKAGGPNYVNQFMTFELVGDLPQAAATRDPELAQFSEHVPDIAAAIANYELRMQEEFRIEHDDSLLIGEDNLRRYLPVRDLRVRITAEDSLRDNLLRVCAAKAAGCRITVSALPGLAYAGEAMLTAETEHWGAQIEFVEESDADLAAMVAAHGTDRLRYAHPSRVPDCVHAAVGETGVHISAAPVIAEGRIELLHYLREQSLSYAYHRYGNLGDRTDER